MTDAAKSQSESDAATRAPRTATRMPRTERGRRTWRALLDAAAREFGTRGFHATGITDITRRAGVALGSFYTWFGSKETIFRAVVQHLSEEVRIAVAPHIETAPTSIAAERAALRAFLVHAAANRHIYRIIGEAEFVAPDAYVDHYCTTVSRMAERLRKASANGEFRDDIGEVEAWAIAGMNVFLGLRYSLHNDGEELADIAERANRLLAHGLLRK